MSLKKIFIIGPESTGKSTLCALLARHYSTVWCPEFAREYLHQRGNGYDYDDLLSIAAGQQQLIQQQESDAIANNLDLLFIDTEMVVMKVWAEYVFNKCHHYILKQFAEQCADLYLLCNTDLPWVKDDLREYPDENIRLQLYNMYKDALVHQEMPWVEITGADYESRLRQAIEAVSTIIS